MKWLLRGLVVVVALGVLGAVGFVAMKQQIGEAMFRSAAMKQVGRDRSADLPDGLQVYLCGTGSPLPDPTRNGPCVGVVAGKRAFVFDAGSGGARRLARMGFPTGRVEHVYLTHLHSDHIDGLGDVMLQAWVGGSRHAPLPVSGPAGVADVVAGFNAAYRIDSGYRTAHHGVKVADPEGFGGVAEEIDIPDGAPGRKVVLEDGGVRITAITVDHGPVKPAFGYRIEYKGRSVALSGDTVYFPGFVEAAKGADLMLHEALNPKLVMMMHDAADKNGQPNLAQVMHDIINYHSTPEDAARAAKEAGVKRLVLYHIVPPLPSRLLDAAFLGDAHKVFSGPLEIGADGELFSLPAGSTDIRRTRPG